MTSFNVEFAAKTSKQWYQSRFFLLRFYYGLLILSIVVFLKCRTISLPFGILNLAFFITSIILMARCNQAIFVQYPDNPELAEQRSPTPKRAFVFFVVLFTMVVCQILCVHRGSLMESSNRTSDFKDEFADVNQGYLIVFSDDHQFLQDDVHHHQQQQLRRIPLAQLPELEIFKTVLKRHGRHLYAYRFRDTIVYAIFKPVLEEFSGYISEVLKEQARIVARMFLLRRVVSFDGEALGNRCGGCGETFKRGHISAEIAILHSVLKRMIRADAMQEHPPAPTDPSSHPPPMEEKMPEVDVASPEEKTVQHDSATKSDLLPVLLTCGDYFHYGCLQKEMTKTGHGQCPKCHASP